MKPQRYPRYDRHSDGNVFDWILFTAKAMRVRINKENAARHIKNAENLATERSSWQKPVQPKESVEN